ncbi:rhomboid family intramembrane serine protease [Allorhodopirellula solitaria]|uniref:Rhomboid protease GluP n=1 Tax=Allorhodopirellula solitaria TaxID=2527987 RepID=A0A5C5XA97_9BACT|nr:rhomboid family intramembrane serine protease [Allorhodopirellula solitaria]TWT59233.1 Rhomboid protease GluP [Allorhodopirellula solitaria]
MRRIGNLPGESQANRFCDYLQTQSIDAKASSTDESAPAASTSHDIWVRHEQDVPRAREFFAEYEANPSAKEYDVSAEAARQRKQRSQQIAQKIAAQKKAQMQIRRSQATGFGGGQSPGSIPVTIGFVVLATIIGFVTNFSDLRVNQTTAIWLFNTLSCVDFPLYQMTGDLMASVKRGEIWRLFTPMLLHGSMMHLAFNMLNLVFLGGVVERIHGHWFFLALFLACGGVGTLVQILLPPAWGGAMVIGASGGVLGIFGFIWIRPKVQQGYPVEIPPIGVIYMLGFIALCFTPLMPGIANGAHIGGLVTGMLIAVAVPKPK